ncbi:MAG: EF-hand domain-containing protein [Kiritimatiellia bacterium]
MKHLFVLGALVAATLSFADEPKKPTPPRRENPRLIAEFDKDGDGKLNAEEKAAAQAAMEKRRQERIKKFDKDGDGKLNEAERKAMREAMRSSRPQANPARQRAFAEGMIKNFDKNGDGKLDVDELVAMQNARPPEARRPAHDKDGKVEKGHHGPKDRPGAKHEKGKCKKAKAKADGAKDAACVCSECACDGKCDKAKCACQAAEKKVATDKAGDK